MSICLLCKAECILDIGIYYQEQHRLPSNLATLIFLMLTHTQTYTHALHCQST